MPHRLYIALQETSHNLTYWIENKLSLTQNDSDSSPPFNTSLKTASNNTEVFYQCVISTTEADKGDVTDIH